MHGDNESPTVFLELDIEIKKVKKRETVLKKKPPKPKTSED